MRKPLLALAVVGALALAGCSSDATSDASDSDAFSIVTTTTQIGDFATEVAGDSANVTQLLQPGQSAHAFDPSPQALAALESADVLVINGAGLEAWLDSAVSASGFDGVTIDLSKYAHLHEGEGHDHAEESGDAHEHADEAASDHGGLDPHIWSDPHNVHHMVEGLIEELSAEDAANADTYRTNGSAYLAKIEALDEWMHASADTVQEQDRLLVTNHDTFSYLAEALDITLVGSVMPSFDDNAEPSAAEIDALVAKIKGSGVRAVFSETSINPALADTIANEAGVEVFSGENALYADSLGAAGSTGATYIGSQVHNMTRMMQSWGAEPLPVPAELQ